MYVKDTEAHFFCMLCPTPERLYDALFCIKKTCSVNHIYDVNATYPRADSSADIFFTEGNPHESKSDID